MPGKSSRLRARDIRDVMRLVGDMRLFGHDQIGWRYHAGRELARLTDAAVAMTIQAFFTPDGPTVAAMTDSGWQCVEEQQSYYAWLASREFDVDPMVRVMTRLGNTTYGWTRRQAIEDREWYSSVSVNEARRSAGVDDCAFSSVALPGGGVNQLSMHRPWGDMPFRRRDAVLLSLFNHELQRIWFISAQHEAPLTQLPGYLRRTLNTVLDGSTEKESATRLKLTESTLHTYVKQLYVRLKVSSRRELISRFGGQQFGPRLTIVNRYHAPRELISNGDE